MSEETDATEEHEFTKGGNDDLCLVWRDQEGFWNLATFDNQDQRLAYGELLGDFDVQSFAMDQIPFHPVDLTEYDNTPEETQSEEQE